MQVVQSAATGIVPVNITQFSVTSGTLYYGQAQPYGADVTSNPLFPGPFYWYNGTQITATLPSLDNATTSGVFENGIVSQPYQSPLSRHCASANVTGGQHACRSNLPCQCTHFRHLHGCGWHAVFPGAMQGSSTGAAAGSGNKLR